jgi:hypothetical protein
MINVEHVVKCELAGETEVLGENLCQCHFVHHESHMTWPRLEPGPLLWEVCDYIFLFEYLGVESILGQLGTAATPGQLYMPRVIEKMEKLVESTVFAGETELLWENLPRRHFVHHKFHLLAPGANPGHRGGKPETNGFSCGSAPYMGYCDACLSVCLFNEIVLFV